MTERLSATGQSPEISAIICTYNRADLLTKALGAFCGQTLPAEIFEVIVIDDGSVDDTRRIVEYFQRILPIRYAFQANAGLASGKNHGLFLARAPIILFLDDDDVADSCLLEQHCIAHRNHPRAEHAILGYTGLSLAVAKSPLMHYVTEIGCQLFSYPGLQDGAVLDFSYFWGGRSSCKRAFLLEHGVFNPVFRFGAEDIELGYRLSKAGLKVIYQRKAISHMIRPLDFDAFCQRTYRQGQSNWVFSKLHSEPEIEAWTQTNSSTAWPELALRFDHLMVIARHLDKFARTRADAGLPMEALTLKLLYQSYHRAFEANRIRGMFEKAQEGAQCRHG
jgi:glycosyltransferase involved in cell wall biosynthesis